MEPSLIITYSDSPLCSSRKPGLEKLLHCKLCSRTCWIYCSRVCSCSHCSCCKICRINATCKLVQSSSTMICIYNIFMWQLLRWLSLHELHYKCKKCMNVWSSSDSNSNSGDSTSNCIHSPPSSAHSLTRCVLQLRPPFVLLHLLCC